MIHQIELRNTIYHALEIDKRIVRYLVSGVIYSIFEMIVKKVISVKNGILRFHSSHFLHLSHRR